MIEFLIIGQLSLTCPSRKRDEIDPFWTSQIPTTLVHPYYEANCAPGPRIATAYPKPLFKAITLSPEYTAGLREEERFNEIAELDNDWDGYGAIPPSRSILGKSKGLLNALPIFYREKLDLDYIFPNPNGTISIEWRNSKNVISIEIGESISNFYAILNGRNIIEENITGEMPATLKDSLEDFFVGF